MYICSHPIPSEIKVDLGSEFRQGLDSFLAKYSISLSASKAYSKGSSSNAESAIRLVKSALRQLCLTHTANWPELLPLLVQGINATGLYGTTTSRSNLYFSPFSYANHLQLNGLLVPEAIFNQHYDQMKHIVKRRQNRLSQRQVLDKTKYQPGNLVLAVNHPVKNNDTKGLSQELAMTVRGIYYVKQVLPSHLRLIGLFTGEERSLPREFCVKLSLANIAQLQVQLEALQMQKVSSSLFKANKFLPPDAAKTWNFLLGKGGTPLDSSAIDCMPEELADQDLESGSQPLDNEDSEPHIRNRKVLRSGQAYLNIPTTPRFIPRSILKPAPLDTSFAQDSQALKSPVNIQLSDFPPPQPTGQSDSVSHLPLPGHESDSLVTSPPPGHDTPEVIRKSIRWKDQLSIRFLAGTKPHDFTQKLLVHTEQSCIIPKKTSLMLMAFSLDMSRQELCYTSSWSDPSPVNDVLTFS